MEFFSTIGIRQRDSNTKRRRKHLVGIQPTKDDPEETTNLPPPSNTLSSLRATQQYFFRLPKNRVWDHSETPIEGDLGRRKFVSADKNKRCLLVHKQSTEAILVADQKHNTVHVCSFSPQEQAEKETQRAPLFEWGTIVKKKRHVYQLKTPYDGSFSLRCDGTALFEIKSSNHKDRICAKLKETDTAWECHVRNGIDPAMMVCFLVGIEVLRANERKQHHRSLGSFRIHRESKTRSQQFVHGRSGRSKSLWQSTGSIGKSHSEASSKEDSVSVSSFIKAP